jgi:acyl-CoA carboxylase subunit beta
MFSGRGIIPLEAARVGVTTAALDLSPVATLASKILAVYPLIDWTNEPALPFQARLDGVATQESVDEELFANGASEPRLVSDKVPADVREILARVVDGSRFAEWKPLYGANLVCGWASVHGYPVGVLANAQAVLFSEESNKAAHFIQLANQADTPLLFLQNTTGYMVGAAYERRGIIKDGAKMINAVANSTVPHVTLILGASYGAGGYGMAGRAYDPRFLFTWPASRSAVMGPEQLAGVMSLLSRASAESAGRPFDEEADRSMREAVRDHVDAESRALFNTGLLYDDGIIDPRDTRTVLGIALSACHSGEVKGTDGYGVFRM